MAGWRNGLIFYFFIMPFSIACNYTLLHFDQKRDFESANKDYVDESKIYFFQTVQ